MAYPTMIPVRLFKQGEYAVINGEKYVPERTCRMEAKSGGYIYCSNCNAHVLHPSWEDATTFHSPSFCPNCGAKVIE